MGDTVTVACRGCSLGVRAVCDCDGSGILRVPVDVIQTEPYVSDLPDVVLDPRRLRGGLLHAVGGR